MKETPYWTDQDLGEVPRAGGALPAKTNVLIIGSGYTGLSAALVLRQSGVEVTVIDKGDIGGDASTKTGGMALPGLSGDIHSIGRRFGMEIMQRFFDESLESVNCVERLVKEHRIDCHFMRRGHVKAAYKPSHVEALKRERDFYAKHLNHSTRLIGPGRIRSEIASDYYHGGLLDESGAGIQPAKYAIGLAAAAARSGAVLHAGVEARSYVRKGVRYRVSTSRGDILADKLLLATNGHPPAFLPLVQLGYRLLDRLP